MNRWQVNETEHKLRLRIAGVFLLGLLLLLIGLPAESAKAGSASVPIKVSSKEADDNLQVTTLLPEYPPEARAKGIEGTVRLRIVISETGKVTGVKALSGDPLLVPPAVTLVKRFPYRPFTRNGKRVVVTTEVTIPFVLHPKTPKEIYDGWQLHLENARRLRRNESVEAALSELQQALDEAKKLGDMDVADTYGEMATLYFKEGRYGDAEPALTHRLDILRHSQTQDEVEIANTQADLAAAYLAQNKLAVVQQLLERAIPVQEKYLMQATLQDSKDAYATRLAHSTRSLAMFHDLKGQPSTAEPFYKRAISLGAQRLSADDEVLTMRCYAEMLTRLGRSDEAAKLREEAAALQLGLNKQ